MRILVFVLSLLVSITVNAQKLDEPAPAYVEGKHYQVLSPSVRTITPGKIEVTEAFSYSCGHCFSFEPLIKAWEKKQAEDVELVKLPVIWRPSMQVLARIMYTGQALKIYEQINERTFNAFHKESKKITTEADAMKIFKAAGVPEDKFKKTFNSFGVSSQVQQADARTRSMKVTGTPQLFVDGRYVVSAGKELSHKEMLEVVDFLVKKVRTEK